MTPAEEATTISVGGAKCLRFSADGKMLLVGNPGPTKLIDVVAGKEVAVLLASGVMGISTDANLLTGPSGAEQGTVWDATAGRATATLPLPRPTDVGPSLTLAPDGKRIAVCW